MHLERLCAFWCVLPWSWAPVLKKNNLNRILRPPEVTIDVPSPGDRVRKGAPARFEGTAIDSFDQAEDMVITWILDQDTPLSPTSVEGDLVTLDLDLEELSLGEHLMQLQAVDQDDMEAIIGIPFLVDGAISAPLVEIESPETGTLFAVDEQITFLGAAEDNNTEPDDLVFAWFSDLDGPLTGAISQKGRSVLITDRLVAGTHQISLEATDGDGEVGRDEITISVGDLMEPVQRGDVVFSELMINPQIVDDNVGEWVELYNAANYAVDVGGYTFRDNDSDNFTLEGPLLVAPGDYIVLCANMDLQLNGGVACDGPFRRKKSGALALGNNGDEVILERPDGVVIDEVVYSRSWFSAGIAIGVDPGALGADNNDAASDWCNQTTVITGGGEPGTPGRDNDPC